MIWGEVMEEQTRHTIKTTPDGKVVDKMSDAISKAIKFGTLHTDVLH